MRLLVLAALLLFGLQGCGEKEEEESSSTEDQPAPSASRGNPQPPQVGVQVREEILHIHEKLDPAVRAKKREERQRQKKAQLIKEMTAISAEDQSKADRMLEAQLQRFNREQLDEEETPTDEIVNVGALEDDVEPDVSQDGIEVDRIAEQRLAVAGEDGDRLIFRLRRQWAEMIKEKPLWTVISVVVLTMAPLALAALMEILGILWLRDLARSMFQGFFGLLGNVLHSVNVANLVDFPLFDTSVSRQYLRLKHQNDDEWFQKVKSIQKSSEIADILTIRKKKEDFQLVRQKLGPSQLGANVCESMLVLDIVDIRSFSTQCSPGQQYPFAPLVRTWVMDPLQRLLHVLDADLHQALLYFLDLKLTLVIQRQVANLPGVRNLFTLLEQHTPAFIVDPIMHTLASLFSFVLQGLVTDLCISAITVVSAVASASGETNILTLVLQKGSSFLKWFDVVDVVGKWMASGTNLGIAGRSLNSIELKLERDNIVGSWKTLCDQVKLVVWSVYKVKVEQLVKQQDFVETDSTLGQVIFGFATLSTALSNFKTWVLFSFLASALILYLCSDYAILVLGAVIISGNLIHHVAAAYLGSYWSLVFIDPPN